MGRVFPFLVRGPEPQIILGKDEVQEILHERPAFGVIVAELDAPSDPNRPRVPLLNKAVVDLFQAVVRLDDDPAVLFEDRVPGFAESESCTSLNQYTSNIRGFRLYLNGRKL